MTVDSAILEKYLAIKFLRNTIAHGGWDEEERNHVESQGFQTNILKLRSADLDEMRRVNDRMTWYVALVPAVKKLMTGAT